MSTVRQHQAGTLAADEARAEGRYLPQSLELVRRLWPTHSAAEITTAIQARCRYKASVKLVYALKARLDTAERHRAK